MRSESRFGYLLEKGSLRLTITLESPFQDKKKHIYFDQVSPPKTLNEQAKSEPGENSFAKVIRFESIDPLVISIVPIRNDNSLKQHSASVKKEWQSLRDEAKKWSSIYLDLRLVLTLPIGMRILLRFDVGWWNGILRNLSDEINAREEKFKSEMPNNKSSRDLNSFKEAREHLVRLKSHYDKLITALNSIASDREFDSGPVLYTSDGEMPALPPNVEGRQPFKFKYRIESEGDVDEATSVEEPSRNVPDKPQPTGAVGKP